MTQGTATEKTKDAQGNIVKYKSWTNKEVWVHSGLPSTKVALRMQRLKWYGVVFDKPWWHQ